MPTPAKPVRTGSSHTLSFEKLSAPDFERLCLWLVSREGYERAEHLGEAGGEGGRDVVAWKDGRRFVFQCKRVRSFTAAHARAEIEKLRRLPAAEQPHELVFVVSRAVSADTRSAARIAWSEEASCHFWAGNELDERVKRHPDLLAEFFQLPPERESTAFRHNLPFSSLGPLFQGRETVLARLRETLERAPAGWATAIAGKAVHGLGGVGKTRLAIEYAWQHAAEYSALLFVGAGSPADLRRNLAVLCERNVLDLPEQAVPEEESREAAVLRWLGEQPGWLLILDNVDSEDAAVAVDALVALGPEPIPESLLGVPAPRSSSAWARFFRLLLLRPALRDSAEVLRDAIVELATYSLVTRAAKTTSPLACGTRHGASIIRHWPHRRWLTARAVEKMRQAVLQGLEQRFGTVPQRVRRRIEAIRSIERLAEFVAKLPSLETAGDLVALRRAASSPSH